MCPLQRTFRKTTMIYEVTVESVRECLDNSGSRCPVEYCGCTDVRITTELGDSHAASEEHYVCNDCGTEWSVYLFAERLSSIMVSGYDREYMYGMAPGRILAADPDIFHQRASPFGSIKEALEDFLRAMRSGHSANKAEAIARLAHIARVDIKALPEIKS